MRWSVIPKSEFRNPKFLSLFLVGYLLFSCGALWQTDVPGAI